MRKLLPALLLLASSTAAPAQDWWRPDRLVLQGGVGHSEGVRAFSVGTAWDGAWQRELGPFSVTGQAQLLLNTWRARAFGGGHQRYYQLALLPLARLNFGQGRSPWYLEGGIGLSYTDKLYTGPDKQMSTKFNFYDMLGFGRRFGPDRGNEIGLRLVHVSNANLKRPNPGEDFLLLYYAAQF